ncbi:MAG: hypothetical protein ACUVSV_13690 [Armatimonadota bacterium]
MGQAHRGSCSSCHWGLNKLNHPGRMFLLRGHRMPDEEGIGTESYNLADYTSWASKVRFTAYKDADLSTKFDVESLPIYSADPLTKPSLTSSSSTCTRGQGMVPEQAAAPSWQMPTCSITPMPRQTPSTGCAPDRFIPT